MNFPGFQVALQPGADQPEAEAIIASLPGMTWHCVNELTRQHTAGEGSNTGLPLRGNDENVPVSCKEVTQTHTLCD